MNRLTNVVQLTNGVTAASAGYRYYAPGWQRWVNRDQIQEHGGLNLYRFVSNSPKTTVDAHGLHGIPPGWGLNVPSGCDPNAFKDALQRYINACKSGQQPQSVDCDTICNAFFGNVSAALVIQCTDSCEKCNLHNFGKLRKRTPKPTGPTKPKI